MADETEGSPFEFVDVRENIELSSSGGGKKLKLSPVSGGIFKADSSVPRFPGEDEWKDIVHAQAFDLYLTLHTLEERLNHPDLRKADYDAMMVGLKKRHESKPFELWDRFGDLVSPGSQLVPTPDTYNDEKQLECWIKVAKKLGGKPPKHISLKYGRFSLRPSKTLMENVIDKKKGELLYCTPAEIPVFGVTTEKLRAIIAASKDKFDGWPTPVVMDYEVARAKGLKLVGRNFLQLYFMWMQVDHYKELWKDVGVSKLLHEFHANERACELVNGMLKQPKVVTSMNETVINVSSRKIGGSSGRTNTKTIMGQSATLVAAELWGNKFITSGMGKNVKAEWLHRVALSLGGPDAIKNIVFGTWECNTDMIRAENFITELTKKDAKRGDYSGRLTTVNKSAGTVSRFRLQKTNTTATVPTWAQKYPWLSLSLNYEYEMKSDRCPLKADIVQDISFDPWSIYVPLSIEPRLDAIILKDLRSENIFFAPTVGIPHPPPNPALPEYSSDAYSALAWSAAIKGLPSVELPDAVIKRPTIAAGSLSDNPIEPISPSKGSLLVDTPVPQDGFFLLGEVDVFGSGVVGELQKWIGPAPEGVVDPSVERVIVSGDFRLSMLIPLIRRTLFDDIIFHNVEIYHQNYLFDETRSIGWHFSADWVINSSCGALYDILTKVLQVNEPILNLRASFGQQENWKASLRLHSFILEGVFPGLTISPVDGLTMTSIGVRLLGIRGFSFTPEPHSTLSFGFGIFGKMNLDVPGSIVPLYLDYEMGLVGSSVNLSAEISDSLWKDALGVKGLLLEDVVFGTSFSATSPWKSFAFDVSATFSYWGSQAFLQGSIAAGGHISFTAELDNFGTDKINDMFFALFGKSLTMPDFDVHVGSAILSIAAGQGLSLSLFDVNIAGHTAASIEVTLSSSGASLSGALSSNTIAFDDVELRDAQIKLSLWATGKKRNVDFMLGGMLNVDFLDSAVGAVVHLYPGEGGVEWAVVAELSAQGRPLPLSDVVPAVKNSFVDFSLENVVFIAASKDNPLAGELFPKYHVRKGIQVFGLIDQIPALNDLLRQDVKHLVLNAGWSKASGFELLVSLPAESTIDLGNDIKTTPITLGLRTKPIELSVMAGVQIPVKDSTSLDFSFVLAANAVGAGASAQMNGWWVEPFGIENLKIGPEVTLSIKIVYGEFVVTGLPSELGVSGGLKIGSIGAFLAMNVTKNPNRQMLFGEVKKLDISDVVTFAGTLLQQDIPKIPDGLLKFEELKVYICPSGVVLGNTSYPQGFSFNADLLLLDKRANIQCTVDKARKSIDIIGGIDNFELGPLSVHGSKDPRATLECHIGVAKQQLTVDGVVSLFDAKVQTYINIQFLPEPIFKFFLMLEFAKLFMFKLDAALLGSIHDRLSDADFSLHAELENDILEYIAQQVVEQFEAAKVAATQGLVAAREKVNEAKKSWEDEVTDAEEKVERAQQEWESYERSIRDSSQPIIDEYVSEISRLQGEVDKARGDYNNAMETAQKAVGQANKDRAAALEDARRAVDDAERAMNSAIDDARQKLNDAEQSMSKAFGNAGQTIDDAKQKVADLQKDIDKTQRDHDNANIFKKPGLWLKLQGLKAAKEVAIGVLDAARAVLTGPEYLAKKGAIETARLAVDAARTTGQVALSKAQKGLQVADEASEATVDAAKKTLEGVKNGAEFVAFEGAKEALEAFKKAHEMAYEAAMAAIEGLMNSAEFVTFNVAKAGLEVVKGSTAVLDAANQALSLAEKASQNALSILQEVVKFGAKGVNIKMVILSGTLRGILGIGDSNARPLSAVIKGFVVGQSFDIKADFDPREPVAFITAIFKKLWDMVSDAFSFTMEASQYQPGSETLPNLEKLIPGPLLAARSKLLQQRPDVLRMLADKSELISIDIPRGPFSGTPIVPSFVVARKAFILMQEESGNSVFDDLDRV